MILQHTGISGSPSLNTIAEAKGYSQPGVNSPPAKL